MMKAVLALGPRLRTRREEANVIVSFVWFLMLVWLPLVQSFAAGFGVSSRSGTKMLRPTELILHFSNTFQDEAAAAPPQELATYADDPMTQRNLRFSGVGRLYVDDSSPEQGSDTAEKSGATHLSIIDRLQSATVAVIGLGGVGSWAAEALCRSGIGSMILIDLDEICISNTNRQLHALSSTVGRSKIEEMRKRLLDINPLCNITLVHEFVSPENVDEIFDTIFASYQLTVCLDAIDEKNEKTALIAACTERGIPIVTCGGAAGRSDPTKIVSGDLVHAQEDRLLFWTRKSLRQKRGFPKGPAEGKSNNHNPKKWNITAVFSTEVQKSVPQAETSSLRRCDGALGTACFVTGTYGFVAAARIVDMIARNELIIPKRPRQCPTN